MPEPHAATRDTKQLILDAAEELFADHGFDATSMRAITARAGVNLAAVNYHYGSKDALIQAVFSRRLVPLNRERLDLLQRAVDGAGPAGPPLERIVEAFVAPPLRRMGDEQTAVFMRLFGQALSQRDPRMRGMFTEQFHEVRDRFVEALARALPELEPRELFWRMLFMIGAMAHVMALSDRLPDFSRGLCDPADGAGTIGRLVRFVSAGMRSAPAGEPGP